MRFWIEWGLALHRAFWFPVNWALGLERPSIESPIQFAPAMLGTSEPDVAVAGGRARGKACPPKRQKTRRSRTKV